MPKADALSAEAVTRRLKQVSILRRLCLDLGRAKVVSTRPSHERRDERTGDTASRQDDVPSVDPAGTGD